MIEFPLLLGSTQSNGSSFHFITRSSFPPRSDRSIEGYHFDTFFIQVCVYTLKKTFFALPVLLFSLSGKSWWGYSRMIFSIDKSISSMLSAAIFLIGSRSHTWLDMFSIVCNVYWHLLVFGYIFKNSTDTICIWSIFHFDSRTWSKMPKMLMLIRLSLFCLPPLQGGNSCLHIRQISVPWTSTFYKPKHKPVHRGICTNAL